MIVNNRSHYSLPGVSPFFFSFFFGLPSFSSLVARGGLGKSQWKLVSRDYFLVLDRDVYKASPLCCASKQGWGGFWMTLYIYFRSYSIAT